jgi:AraC-like DNA-binding protein
LAGGRAGCCAGCRTPTANRDRLIHLRAALAEHLRHGPSPNPEVLYVWRRIRASGGSVAVGELAEAVGWTRRHLTRKFTQRVGLPPKTVARIRRLHIALDLLGTLARRSTWATLPCEPATVTRPGTPGSCCVLKVGNRVRRQFTLSCRAW